VALAMAARVSASRAMRTAIGCTPPCVHFSQRWAMSSNAGEEAIRLAFAVASRCRKSGMFTLQTARGLSATLSAKMRQSSEPLKDATHGAGVCPTRSPADLVVVFMERERREG
jgi:hypothetical protein